MSELTDDRLLPCPFCGGEAKIVKGDESAYVQCLDMKMHRALWFQGDNTAADEVRDQWNRRAAASTSTEGAGVIEQCAKVADEFAYLTAQKETRVVEDAIMYAAAEDAARDIAARIRALNPPASKVTTDEAKPIDLAEVERVIRKVNPGRTEDHIKSVALDALTIIRALSARSP